MHSKNNWCLDYILKACYFENAPILKVLLYKEMSKDGIVGGSNSKFMNLSSKKIMPSNEVTILICHTLIIKLKNMKVAPHIMDVNLCKRMKDGDDDVGDDD